jgi:hypothetical protein
MSAFGQGNSEEYLVHVIIVKELLKQKGTVQDVMKAFKAISEVRRRLEPLLEAPKDGETMTEKEEQKKLASAIMEELKTTREFAWAETMKAYELFHCFIVSKAQTQWDKIVQEMYCMDH